MSKKFKLLLGLVVVLALSLTFMATAFAADGDEPTAATPDVGKTVVPNGDGTYTISLSIKGDADKSATITPTNVIMILDASNSMYSNSTPGEVTYTETDGTGNGLYGLIDGEYVLLERQGGPGNRTFWYNGVQYTGQRYIRNEANLTRMQATLNSMEGVAQTLLSKNGADGNPADAIEVALIVFSGSTQTAIELDPTTSYSAFETAAEEWRPNHPNNHGTSWSTALGLVDDVNFDDEDQTFVIFFTDGAPTNDSFQTEPEYNNSLAPAKNIVDKVADGGLGYTLFSIFAFGDGENYLRQLTNYAYGKGEVTDDSEYFYSASDAAALQQAFDDILEKIELAGIAEAEMDDGVSVKDASGTTTLMDLVTVVPNSFKYYRAGGVVEGSTSPKYSTTANDGKGEEWTDIPADCKAEVVDGEVVWDLAKATDTGVLEDEVVYTVTFECATSQDALDLVADLKNDPGLYDKLVEEGDPRVDYITKSGDDYLIKTNSDVNVSYKDTRVGDDVIDYTPQITIDPVPLEAEMITIEKSWYGSYKGEEDASTVTIGVIKDNDDEQIESFVLEKSGDKHVKDIYISTGVMTVTTTTVTDEETGDETEQTEVNVVVPGHDFELTENIEDSSLTYHWELVSDVMHPMLINNQIKMLVHAEKDPASAPADAIYYKDDAGKVYYKINGAWYEEADATKLTGANYRRSTLNLTKAINGDVPDEEQAYEFTMKLTAPENALDADKTFWFAVQDEDENYISGDDLTTTATREESILDPQDENISDIEFHEADEEYDYDYYTYKYKGTPYTVPAADSGSSTVDGKTVHKYYTDYYYFASGSEVTVELQAGWNLRFTNVLTGTQYEFTETVPNGYKTPLSADDITVTPDDAASSETGGDEAGDEVDEGDEEESDPPYTITDNKIAGTLIQVNEDYVVTFTNQYASSIVEVVKTFSGITEDQIPAGFTATVSFEAPDGYTGEVPEDIDLEIPADEEEEQPGEGADNGQPSNLAAADGENEEEAPYKFAQDGLTLTWTIEGVPVGLNVTVTEDTDSADDVEDYALVTEGDDASVTEATTKKADPDDPDAKDAPTVIGETTTLNLTNNYISNIGTLTVTKTFAGDITELSEKELEEILAALEESFEITLTPTIEEGTTYTLVLTPVVVQEGVEQTAFGPDENSKFPTFTWTIEVPAGIYTVEETEGSADVENYEVTTTYTGSPQPEVTEVVQLRGETGDEASEEPVDVIVAPGTTDAEATVTNTYDREKGYLQITKIFDGVGEDTKLPDVKVTVKDSDGKTFTTGTVAVDEETGESVLLIPDVPTGTYTVEESKAPSISGYKFVETIYDPVAKDEEEAQEEQQEALKASAAEDEEEAPQFATIEVTVENTEDSPAEVTITNVYEEKDTPPGPPAPRYVVEYESNGGTEFPPDGYKAGAIAYLTNEPIKPGYTFVCWCIDEELTTPVSELFMDRDYLVYAKWEETPVPGWLDGENHYAYLIGYPDDMVHPERNITRAEVATIFFRMLREEVRDEYLTKANSFGDVAEGMWFNTPISTMAAMGIVTGYPDGDFHPNANITRAEFATIAARFDQLTDGKGTHFSDIESHWAKLYIECAAKKGWIAGYPDGTFGPERLATRAEVATLINRVLNRDPESPDDLLPGMIEWPDNMDAEVWYYLPIQEATNSHDYERETKSTETWVQLTENPDWTAYNN